MILLACGLGGLWLWSQLAPTHEVLVAAEQIERGELITADQLTTAAVGSIDGLTVLTDADRSQIVDRVAQVDIAAGAPVGSGMVDPQRELGDEQAVVGLVLEPGEYPIVDLATSDRVDLILQNSPVGVGQEPTAADVDTPAVIHNVEILAVSPIDDFQNTLFVSVLVDSADAPTLSRSAANDDVRLVLVPQPKSLSANQTDPENGNS